MPHVLASPRSGTMGKGVNRFQNRHRPSTLLRPQRASQSRPQSPVALSTCISIAGSAIHSGRSCSDSLEPWSDACSLAETRQTVHRAEDDESPCSHWAKPMIESEWLACTDPTPMLDYLRSTGRASDRK